MNEAFKPRRPSALFRSVLIKTGPPAWSLAAKYVVEIIRQIGAGTQLRGGPGDAAFGADPAVYIAGGEPFDDIESLEQVADAARTAGLPLQVITGGSWASDHASAGRVLDRFAGRLQLLSIAASNLTLDAEAVRRIALLVEAARSRSIVCSLQLALSPDGETPSTLFDAKALNEDSFITQVVPFVDREHPGDAFLLNELPPSRCRGLFSFVVDACADAYPCFPMLGQQHFRLGNVLADGVAAVAGAAARRADLQLLWREGPGYIGEVLKRAARPELLPDRYIDPCHFHRLAISDGRVVALLDSQLSTPQAPVGERRARRVIPIHTSTTGS